MMIPKKILVLVDGSERSIQTVNYVKEFMPVDADTRIVLFHVFSGIPEGYRDLENNPACVEAIRQLRNWEVGQKLKIQAHMEQAKKILITSGFPEASVEIKLHALESGVARDIIAEARNGYCAVVLRRRGMGALTSMILGSIAVKLLQSLDFAPIIIVGPAPPVRKVLLAVDGSPASMKAVEFVGELLGGQGHEVRLFNVIRSFGGVMPEHPEFGMPVDIIDALKSEVVRLFAMIKEKLVESGFAPEKISEKIVTDAYSRSGAIIQEAEDGEYGTIVVGRRGLSKVEAFFMGRVSNKVVHGGKKYTVWVV